MSFLKKTAYCASFKLGSSFQANFYGIFCNVLITDFICHNGNYKFYENVKTYKDFEVYGDIISIIKSPWED